VKHQGPNYEEEGEDCGKVNPQRQGTCDIPLFFFLAERDELGAWGRIAADRASIPEEAFFSGEAAVGAADRGEGFSAIGAVFCVKGNFSAAALAKKTGVLFQR
jgi:hypothetical protein